MLRNQLNFGEKPFGPIDMELKITRIDGVDLRVLNVTSSCTCVYLNRHEASPGFVQMLRLRITPTHAGRFRQRVVVVVNCSENSVVSFLLIGFFKRGDSSEKLSGKSL